MKDKLASGHSFLPAVPFRTAQIWSLKPDQYCLARTFQH